MFVSPSQAESFGITTLEAWSLGKPVVVGDTPSQREVVEEGVSGFLVPHGDELALAEVLAMLRSDGGLRRALGRAGRDLVVARYTRASVEREYAELFVEAASTGWGRSA